MQLPLALHALGAVALGLFPALGLMLVAEPTRLFLRTLPQAQAEQALDQVQGALTRAGWVSLGVAGLIVLVWALRRVWRPAPARSVTWGCGHTAASPRLQYTAGSFSHDFAQHYRGVMVLLNRRKAPQGYFPDDAYLITDCVDAVERRLYNVIGEGDRTASLVSRLMHEDDPRLGFALALASAVAIAALVVLAEGALT
jgi:hydrogenase-4 component B